MRKRKGRNGKQTSLSDKNETIGQKGSLPSSIDMKSDDTLSAFSHNSHIVSEISIDSDPDYVSIINEYLQQLNKSSTDEPKNGTEENNVFNFDSSPYICIGSQNSDIREDAFMSFSSNSIQPGQFVAGSAPQPTLKEQFRQLDNYIDDYSTDLSENFLKNCSINSSSAGHNDLTNRFRHRSDEPCGAGGLNYFITSDSTYANRRHYQMYNNSHATNNSNINNPMHNSNNNNNNASSSLFSSTKWSGNQHNYQQPYATQYGSGGGGGISSVEKSLSSCDSAYWTSRNSLVTTPLSMLLDACTSCGTLPPCNESHEQQQHVNGNANATTSSSHQLKDEEELEYLMHLQQNGLGNYMDIPQISTYNSQLPQSATKLDLMDPDAVHHLYQHSLSLDSGSSLNHYQHHSSTQHNNNNSHHHQHSSFSRGLPPPPTTTSNNNYSSVPPGQSPPDWLWPTMLESNSNNNACSSASSNHANVNNNNNNANRERSVSGQQHKLYNSSSRFPSKYTSNGKVMGMQLLQQHQHQAISLTTGGQLNTRKNSMNDDSKLNGNGRSIQPIVDKSNRACSFHLRGHCKKEDCQFAHDLRNVVCRFWAESECYKGDFCPFRHSPLSSSDQATIMDEATSATIFSTTQLSKAVDAFAASHFE